MANSTRMLSPKELYECLPSIGRSLSDVTQSFTLSLKPKKDCPRICDASGPFISGYDGMETKLTAIAFTSDEQAQARAYLHRNSTTYEFKPLLLYKKEGGQMYVLGEYAGFTLEEWIEKGPVLWESSGESSRTTGRGRKPTDAFKIVGQNIAAVLYKLHEKDDYVGNIFTDVCINTLTSRITILCTLPKQLSPEVGIQKDLDQLFQFVNLCNQAIPQQIQSFNAVEYNMFREIQTFISTLGLPIKEKSYIVCHAPIFWLGLRERYNFANMFWQLGKVDKSLYKHVTFKNPPTKIDGDWIAKATSNQIIGHLVDPNNYSQAHIMVLHRNMYNHYGKKVFLETIEDFDGILMNMFPDAFPKAYVELFRGYLPVQPRLIEVLKCGQYALSYGSK